MTIWANCIVNNEENFIWFALMSVVDHVDKILVWDTGSTDKTVQIIKEAIKVKGDKIELKEVGIVDKYGFTKMRQKMLEESKCDWILVLDGDEVWWDDSIKKVVNLINEQGNNTNAIVVPFYSVVGDVYHYQSRDYGEYEILGQKGHLTIRAINKKLSGLHIQKPYGKEGFYYDNNKPIQDDHKGLKFIQAPFMHLTHLKRSSKRRGINKYKYNLGISFSAPFSIPEVFNRETPKDIRSPLKRRGRLYEIVAVFLTPFILIKRSFKGK